MNPLGKFLATTDYPMNDQQEDEAIQEEAPDGRDSSNKQLITPQQRVSGHIKQSEWLSGVQLHWIFLTKSKV